MQYKIIIRNLFSLESFINSYSDSTFWWIPTGPNFKRIPSEKILSISIINFEKVNWSFTQIFLYSLDVYGYRITIKLLFLIVIFESFFIIGKYSSFFRIFLWYHSHTWFGYWQYWYHTTFLVLKPFELLLKYSIYINITKTQKNIRDKESIL